MPTTRDEEPMWKQIAADLEQRATRPSEQQLSLAEAAGIDLADDCPSSVAAVILRDALSSALNIRKGDLRSVPSELETLNKKYGNGRKIVPITGTADEISAWYESCFFLKAAAGLRSLQPSVGDVVKSSGWVPSQARVISSIRPRDGKIFMKGLPHRKAWPEYLEIVSRSGDAGHAEAVKKVANLALNSTMSKSTSLDNYRNLDRWRLDTETPSPESIRALKS